MTPEKYYDAVAVPPDGYVPGELLELEAGRTLDPVRAAALTAAVAHVGPYCYQDHEDGWTQVIAVAKKFEQYLTDENGQRG